MTQILRCKSTGNHRRCDSIEFEKEEDQKNALDWCPWAIQGHCLSLKRWQQGKKIYEAQLHMIQFWVQVHGLEVDKFSKQNSERIGE